MKIWFLSSDFHDFYLELLMFKFFLYIIDFMLKEVIFCKMNFYLNMFTKNHSKI